MSRIALLVCLVTLSAGCEFLKPVTDPTPPPVEGIHYTAIGASDALGIGGSLPCFIFSPCPDGTGYVQTIARRMQLDGTAVTLMNLAIPGAVLGPDTVALGKSYGRDIYGNFLDAEVPFVPKTTTVLTVFAGGNDVNTVAGALAAGLGGSNLNAFIQTQTQNFARDLDAMIDGIRDRAPEARVVIINLPNFAAVPYANGLSLTEKQYLQQISVAFSAQINALASRPNVLVVDLMCDAAMYSGAMYSPDGFHPNDAGYARLADLAFAAASTGSASLPRATCSQMTLF